MNRPLQTLSPRIRFIVGFAVLVLLCTLALSSGISTSVLEDYHPGDVVHRTVVSPGDINSIDPTETARRQNEAGAGVRPVFTFNPNVAENNVQAFRAAWLSLQQQTQERNVDRHALTWSGEGGPLVAAALASHGLDMASLGQLTRILRESSERYIYQDEDAELLKREAVLKDLRNPAAPANLAVEQPQMLPISVARRDLESRLSQLPGWSVDQLAALKMALVPLVTATVTFDEGATEGARKAAIEKVVPAVVSLKRNQVIAREGDTVTEPMLAQFAAVREQGRDSRRWHHFFGLLVIVTAIFWAAWKFIEHRKTVLRAGLSRSVVFALVGSAVFVETLLMRVGFTLADRVATASMNTPFNEPTVWSFAIPFAAAGLLVALLLDTQLAFITGLITALFAAVLSPNGVPMAFYALISNSAAIYGIARYRERQSVTLAGLFSGIMNAVIAVAVLAYTQQPLVLITLLVATGCGLLGGILTSVFTAGGLPVNESVFGILTDVKLLELSNADLPVLGQMAIRAPGTNQHSHAVGQLAEEACRVIDANPLLARIGALYHDIGKLAAPDMFVENQHGNNPHDRIRPSNSARIITSHVTYGSKLAKEIGLPKQIADFIPQHHGTRTLHFFLRKAQAQAAEGETVDESDFRYPGPRPQFKEAAVMMIADSCEAGARSLARPDPENIRAIVSKIVDAILSDGQLDECDLTLREVTRIRESIISSLTAIYHARIDYPGFNPPPVTGPLPPLTSGEIKTDDRAVVYKKASDVPVNKSGEVEDEAIPRTKIVAK